MPADSRTPARQRPDADHDGVGASEVWLPPGPWTRVLDFLVERFPAVPAGQWRNRFARGLILDAEHRPLDIDANYVAGRHLYYFRELAEEPQIPFEATIVYRDDYLLVVDKPHFLPVVPAGRYVQQSLLVRLRRELGLTQLAPLHRIDRGTAGLVLFSVDADSRARYQALFARRAVSKTYHALAPPLPGPFPHERRSRIVAGEPFFRMREVEGEPNSLTRIGLVEVRDGVSLYELMPVTGRKHQLRVHMAALNAPIVNDDLYPQLKPNAADDDHSRPLQLLAKALSFDDPISGCRRKFESPRQL